MTAAAVGTIQTARPWHFANLGALRFADAASDGMHRSWIMLLPEGRYEHPQYGDLDFSRAVLDAITQNFADRVRGIDIALDYDHKASDGDSKAPGWIETLEWRPAASDGALTTPAGLWGLVRWTALGLADVRGEIYRYISAEYRPEYTNDITGKTARHVLIGATLTNRPFMKQMPAVKLSESVSTRPWGEVDKAKLPDSAFLDPKNRRLPIYEGSGALDARGRYTKRGKLNIHGARAALAAIHGARSGKAMTGLPAGVVARLERLLAKHGDGGASNGGGVAASEGMTGAESERMTRIKTGPTAEEIALADAAAQLALADAGVDAGDEDFADASGEGGEELDDGEEMYDDAADGDDDEDADSGDGEPAFDAESDTHGAMTTDGHTHGKYGKHSHDDNGDHSDAPMKRGKGAKKMGEADAASAGTLTLSERAELVQLRERVQLAERELFEATIEKRLRAFRGVVTLAEGTEQEQKITFSKRFRDKYRAFALAEGVRLSEQARAAVDELLQVALSSAAIVPLSTPGGSSDMEARKTIRPASDAKSGSHQTRRLDERMEEIALAEHHMHIDEMRQLAHRGDAKMRELVPTILQRAARDVDYRGA